jgi:hypothetical protein
LNEALNSSVGGSATPSERARGTDDSSVIRKTGEELAVVLMLDIAKLVIDDNAHGVLVFNTNGAV